VEKMAGSSFVERERRKGGEVKGQTAEERELLFAGERRVFA